MILRQNKISMGTLLFPLMNQNWKLQELEVYKLKDQNIYLFVVFINQHKRKLKLSNL